jgi:thioredoxin 1
MENNITNLDLLRFKQIMDSKIPTLVKFINPTCHLCKGLSPIFDEIVDEYEHYFDFAVLNVRKFPKIAKVFELDGVPDLIVVKKNYVKKIPYPKDNEVDPISGYPKDYIIKHLENIIEEIEQMEPINDYDKNYV